MNSALFSFLSTTGNIGKNKNLSRLSFRGVFTGGYSKKWCPGAESNRRHEDFQSSALPTELPGHYIFLTYIKSALIVDGAQGRNRTVDTRIFSPLLYRLSYLGKTPKQAAY